LIRFRAKVGAARFREPMAELPSTIENIGRSDRPAGGRGPHPKYQRVARMMEEATRSAGSSGILTDLSPLDEESKL